MSDRPAVEHLWGFLGALREAGLTPATPKREDFFRAVAASPPAGIEALYWRARITLLSDIADAGRFDEVFGVWFRGHPPGAVAVRSEKDSATRSPRGSDDTEPPRHEAIRGDGERAGADAVMGTRTFAAPDEHRRRLLRQLRKTWPECLPVTRSRRRRAARTGRLDLREVWRQARRTGGEIVLLRWSARPRRTRKLLLLLDVSGSLRTHTPDLLRVAHTAVRAGGGRTEVFTFGTRLTRVTRALSHPDVDASLLAVSRAVLDVDGGTAIGAAFGEFLANPRFLALARGALVIVVSDGLERGDCTAMIDATGRLSRLGHRLVWWSPLACSPTYRPITRGMAGQLHLLDHLGGVRDLPTALAELRHLPAVSAGPRGSRSYSKGVRT